MLSSDEHVVVRLTGDLDRTRLDELASALAPLRAARVGLLDLSRVTFVDLVAGRALADVLERCAGRIELDAPPSSPARRLIEMLSPRTAGASVQRG